MVVCSCGNFILELAAPRNQHQRALLLQKRPPGNEIINENRSGQNLAGALGIGPFANSGNKRQDLLKAPSLHCTDLRMRSESAKKSVRLVLSPAKHEIDRNRRRCGGRPAFPPRFGGAQAVRAVAELLRDPGMRYWSGFQPTLYSVHACCAHRLPTALCCAIVRPFGALIPAAQYLFDLSV